MPKRYSSAQLCKALERLGFLIMSQKGSHKKYKKEGKGITIVPMGKKILPPGTVNGLLDKAGVSKIEFESVI